MSREVTAVVVLAGGTSRRFGGDKLAAALRGGSLLDTALAALPIGAHVVLVGPSRATSRLVTVVREDPPGGGPAAALVTGLRCALAGGADLIAVLPADAPAAGEAAQAMLERLAADPAARALVAVDDEGREQPLQLALRRPAAERVLAAALDGGAGASVRRLLRDVLGADLSPVAQPPRSLFDIDTPAQLAAWSAQEGAVVDALVALVDARRPSDGLPVVLALDGPSGAGKSTLATALRLRTGATVASGDDFYSPAFADTDTADLARLDDAELADRVFDWARLRDEALTPLAAGRTARFRPYDWSATSGPARLAPPRTLLPAPLVVVEGVYAARPELSALVTASVLVNAPAATRLGRLADRGDEQSRAELWSRGESWYFARLRPPQAFDLVVAGTQQDGGREARRSERTTRLQP